jgi:Isoprenylcysteine carboxyl methyltransferase (ICMT) family
VKRILALYPRDWRERYGDEVADLANELVQMGETTAARARLDLAAGAAVERGRLLARRDVLVALLAAGAIAAGLAFGVTRTLHGATATKPYFDTHQAGLLLLVIMLGWCEMEISEFVRGRRSPYWSDRAARNVGPVWCWLTLALGAIAINGADYLAPPLIPAAAIRPGAGSFTVGVVLVLAGIALRGWSFRALGGRYFNHSVKVSPNQPLITSGPYRLLRHPGFAGNMLICIGSGLAAANWVAVAVATLFPLAVVIWRTKVEETAMVAVLGERYRLYAAGHKRLVPLIW